VRKTLLNPIAWGIFLSTLVLVLVGWLGGRKNSVGETAYSRFMELDPNAMGDTLAGIFASLAFIWIVVTVFLQSAELAEQRKELTLTREELRLARQAQEKQVEAAQVQAEIFKDEKASRDQVKAFSEVSALAEEIRMLARTSAVVNASWHFRISDHANKRQEVSRALFGPKYETRLKGEMSELFETINDALISGNLAAKSLIKQRIISARTPNLTVQLSSIRKGAERIGELYASLSPADQVRTDSLGLGRLLRTITEIQAEPDYLRIWGGAEQQ